MPGDPPINTTNGTSFSELKTAYVAVSGQTSAIGNGDLRDGKINTPISLSMFREATFTSGDPVPAASDSDDEISIEDDFCTGGSFSNGGRTFLSGGGGGSCGGGRRRRR